MRAPQAKGGSELNATSKGGFKGAGNGRGRPGSPCGPAASLPAARSRCDPLASPEAFLAPSEGPPLRATLSLGEFSTAQACGAAGVGGTAIPPYSLGKPTRRPGSEGLQAAPGPRRRGSALPAVWHLPRGRGRVWPARPSRGGAGDSAQPPLVGRAVRLRAARLPPPPLPTSRHGEGREGWCRPRFLRQPRASPPRRGAAAVSGHCRLPTRLKGGVRPLSGGSEDCPQSGQDQV